MLKKIKNFFIWSWFLITLPYHLIKGTYLGGCYIDPSEYEYNMFYSMKFSKEGKISYVFLNKTI